VWAETLVALGLLLALVILPGLLATWPLAAGQVEGVLLAPAVGVCLVLLAGTVLGVLEVAWTPLAGVISTLALAAAPALLLRWWPRPVRQVASRPEWAGVVVGLAASALVFTYVTVAAVGSPTAIPQQPDTVFHLGAAAWLSDHQSASFLDAGQYVWTGPALYPGGFQVLNSIPTGWLVTPVTVSSVAVLLVVGGVVVPAGLMLLARATLGRGFLPLAVSGVLSTAFVAFPYSFMAAGVLWSNLLTQALVPSLLAVLWMSLRTHSPRALPTVLGGLLLSFGVVAAQPNGVFAFGLLAYPMLVVGLSPWRARSSPRPKRIAWGLVVVAGPLAVLASAVVAPADVLENQLRDPPGLRYAVLVALKVGEAPLVPGAGLLLVLLAIGVLGSLVDRQRRSWLAGGLVLAVLLTCVPTVLAGELGRRITWPWFNDSVRLVALVAIPATVCVTAGARTASRWLGRVLPHRPSWQAPALVAGLVVALALSSVPQRRDSVAATYQPRDDDQWWVTPSEIRALEELAKYVPDDAVVAANPWRGGSFLYEVARVRTAFPTEKSVTGETATLLASDLDAVGSNRAVCDLVNELDVRFVLTGGSPQRDATDEQLANFHGVDWVGLRSSFVEVSSAGPYTLWRVPPCRVSVSSGTSPSS